MSAQEVVAAHMLAVHVSHPDYDANPCADQEGPFIATPLCRCGRQVEDYPAHLLAALRANGYEVVKLPDQMTDKSSAYYAVRDRPMWLVNDSWTCIDVEGDIEFEAFGQDSIGSGLSPRDARALAAALLAAANAAEGKTHDHH